VADVSVDSSTQVSDNGDNDGYPDNNETVTLDVTITNHGTSPITNTKVKIIPVSPNVDCVSDDQALYGTVGAGATVTNPPGDRFTVHINSSVACSDWQAPPTARFIVLVSADGFDGTSNLQAFTLTLDLDNGIGGTYTLNQNFATDPGWTTTVTPDDSNTCNPPYVNTFHWCAACGNAGGGYGAWTGNAAFGTSGQNYPNYDSSTLNSPALTAAGNVTLQFQVAYRNETQFDGAIVQSKVGNGAWTNVGFTTPAQAATTSGEFCSPLLASTTAWTGTGVTWTSTNVATVTASAGQSIQFRWRNGTDSTNGGSVFGGYGVDNVSIGNLQQTLICEPTRNTGLPGCGPVCNAPTGLTNNSAADASAQDDTGVLVSWSVDAANWNDGGSGTRTYDVLRDGTPIATGLAYGTTSYVDTTGVNGQSYTYSVRYKNGCGSTATTTGAQASDAGCACVASDQCHQGGVCDVNGLCLNPAKPNGSACSDGNACTNSDTCQAGVCQGGTPTVCGPSDQCHVAGTCDTGTGLCSNPAAPNGTSCNDANACTQTDSCQAGVCAGSNPVVCSASDQCHVAGTCDTGTGLCSNPAAPNGTSCNDANACTQTDSCQSGVCAGGNPVVCSASDQCHVAGTCDTGTGLCSNPSAPDGTSCSDGNACTQTDSCQSGVCAGSNPVVCSASDQCHVAGTCDTGTGLCSNPAAPDGTSCSDGNACTQTDSCQAGACAGTNPVVCGALDQCHVAGTCDTGTGPVLESQRSRRDVVHRRERVHGVR
jgi:hypothetical protein